MVRTGDHRQACASAPSGPTVCFMRMCEVLNSPEISYCSQKRYTRGPSGPVASIACGRTAPGILTVRPTRRRFHGRASGARCSVMPRKMPLVHSSTSSFQRITVGSPTIHSGRRGARIGSRAKSSAPGSALREGTQGLTFPSEAPMFLPPGGTRKKKRPYEAYKAYKA